MKTFLSFSSFLALMLILLGAQVSMSSCKKETVYIHDTVPPVALTKTEILAQNTWEIGELFQIVPSSGSDTTHYLRGVENNTGYNQDVVRFTFNANGTGTWVDDKGNSKNMSWEFTSADETGMKLVIGSDITYWSLVSIKEGEILETTANTNFLVSARLVPVPGGG